MTSTGVTGVSAAGIMGAKFSVLSKALLGTKSPWMPTGSQALTPFQLDDTTYILQANGVTTPGPQSKLQFNLPKNSTLIGKLHIEITLSAGRDSSGQNAGVGFNPDIAYNAATNAPFCELVKNVGDMIIDQHQLVYGNANLQQFPGLFHYLFRRLCKNDVLIEATNAQVLGALPPGGNYDTGSERVLVDAFYRGCTLYVPVEELFFVHRTCDHWMPESLALEGQYIAQLAPSNMWINTRNRNVSDIQTMPSITNCILRYQEITLSAAEKENRLKLYKTPQGLVQHFLDLEYQLSFQQTGTGNRGGAPATVWLNGVVQPGAGSLANQGPMTMVVPLNNLRMDMAELIFVVHRVANTSPRQWAGEEGILATGAAGGYSGSYAESNGNVLSILYDRTVVPAAPTPYGSFATQIQVSNFVLSAAGKNLYTFQTDFHNRTAVRSYYHTTPQIGDFIYTIPMCKFPEDRANASGHLSASVLGNLTLTINLPNPGSTITYQVDVFTHSHNLMQSRAGGIVKALY